MPPTAQKMYPPKRSQAANWHVVLRFLRRSGFVTWKRSSRKALLQACTSCRLDISMLHYVFNLLYILRVTMLSYGRRQSVGRVRC